MMKNKVAVLNQGTKVKFAHCSFLRLGCGVAQWIKRLLSAREVLGSYLGWAVDK
jgi:hypothetical protein